MTLQTKFAMLICMLGAIGAVCIGAVVCSFTMLQREVASPIISMAAVLKGLGDVKHRLGLQEMLLRDDEWIAVAEHREVMIEQVEGAVADCLTNLERLEALNSYIDLAGSSTSRQLRRRVESVAGSMRTAPVEAAALAAADEAGHAIRLIERIEGRIAETASRASEHAATLSERLTITLAIAMVNAGLIVLLGFMLLRRWVVKPVRELRRAARRLACGDFQHRVEHTGSDELAQLCAELNRTSEAVAAMQDERLRQERLAATGEMARRLAHNLRNPLAGIRSLAELTRSGLEEESEQVELQTRIITTVDHFERWLAGLLDATSPLTIRPRLVPVDAWLDGVVESHRAAAESRGVRLELECDASIGDQRFDPFHLEQAVVALLSNAIEATHGGGRVRVAAGRNDRARTWQIRVEDSGAGVAPGLGGRIFFPSFSTKQGGRGIGLAVAQQVVFGHGGEIAAQSGWSELGGAVFVITMPGDAKPEPIRRQPPAPRACANGSPA